MKYISTHKLKYFVVAITITDTFAARQNYYNVVHSIVVEILYLSADSFNVNNNIIIIALRSSCKVPVILIRL